MASVYINLKAVQEMLESADSKFSLILSEIPFDFPLLKEKIAYLQGQISAINFLPKLHNEDK